MKKYILLMLFFLNFAFVFEEGKFEITVGMEVKAQGGELGDGYFNGWTVDDWEGFITSEDAVEYGISGNVWTNANDFINNTEPELLLALFGVSLDPSSYATGDASYTGYKEDGSASDRNIPIGQYISVRLRDEDGDGDFDKVYIFGTGGIEIEQSIIKSDPLAEDDDFLAWYQQNFGAGLPEVISDEVLLDYYEDLITEQENSITGSSTGIDTELTEADKIALTASLAANLNAKILSTYGTSSQPMPRVIYDKSRGGYASFINGEIYTNDAFFNLLTTGGDRMSTLMHEYTHYKNNVLGINNPVKNDNGQITNIETGVVPERTEAEYSTEYNVRFLRNKALYPDYSDSSLNLQTDLDMQRKYTYVCSNYYKDEVAARKAELQGEKDGLYVLSDNYREIQSTTTAFFELLVDRALKYESLNNLKPNGSPK